MLFSYAQIGNPDEETREVKDWKLEMWGYERDGVVLGRPYTELWKGETEML
jgi:hypothetical protein